MTDLTLMKCKRCQCEWRSWRGTCFDRPRCPVCRSERTYAKKGDFMTDLDERSEIMGLSTQKQRDLLAAHPDFRDAMDNETLRKWIMGTK